MKPLDESPKVWKFIRASDLGFVVVDAFFGLIIVCLTMSFVGFVFGVSFGLFYSGIILAYFFLKTIMPTNFLVNYILFKTSPSKYVIGPEPSEIETEVKK